MLEKEYIERPVISFVSLPSHSRLQPFALLALSSYLNQRTEYQANILNFPGNSNFEETLLIELKRQKPRIVGFPCFTADYPVVMKLAGLVKQHTACKVVVGNVHASLYPEDFIYEGSPVDYVVIGEGENTLAELLGAISIGKSAIGIAGLALLDSEGKIFRGDKRELIHNLGSLPSIDYNLINMKQYLKPSSAYSYWGIPFRACHIYSSRGCPSVCDFCAAPTLWKCNIGPAVRFRPIEQVVAEIAYLKGKYDIQGFIVSDDSFTISKKRVLDFCRQIVKFDLFWEVQARVIQIDEEVVIAMKKSGCLAMGFGVESGSNSVLKRINKGQTVEQIIYAFDLCRKHGIRRIANIMCNHPGETEHDVQLTRELLERIKPDELSQSVMTPYPGTAIYEKYVKKKPDNYRLFSNVGPEVAEHFKLCEHNIPLQKILEDYWRIVYRFKLPTSFVMMFQNLKYTRKVIFSRFFPEIIFVIVVDLIKWARYFVIEMIPDNVRSVLRRWKKKLTKG